MSGKSADNMPQKPCKSCPWRKKAAQGWLGRSSPEALVLTAFGEQGYFQAAEEQPMPCHETINYEDPEWKEKWEAGWDTGSGTGSLCAGVAVALANRCKVPRHLQLPTREPDRENVFTHPSDFIEHHRGGVAQSWNDDDMG